jgi:hypothetical protein
MENGDIKITRLEEMKARLMKDNILIGILIMKEN